jgi:hypothetical protein
MGIRVEQISHLLPLMSSADQARYGGVVNVARDSGVHVARDVGVVHGIRDATPKRSPKRDASEKKQQSDFASWLSLQNSKGHKVPFCWHATHTRSKATPGTPDFWVGINGKGIWFEFKRDSSCRLTPEQEEFRSAARYSTLNTTSCTHFSRRSTSWSKLLRFARPPRSRRRVLGVRVPVSGAGARYLDGSRPSTRPRTRPSAAIPRPQWLAPWPVRSGY